MVEQITRTNEIAAKDTDQFRMSILIPNYKYDPSPLLDKIIKEAAIANLVGIELVIVDDGSGMPEICDLIQSKLAQLPFPAKLIEFGKNQGRSKARNALVENSKGAYLLFLDSDMLPDCDNFLRNWLGLIDKAEPTVTYGGYSVKQIIPNETTETARLMAQNKDCLGAFERNQRGPLAVATSNLLVRRDILEKISFDTDIVGWGWEDVDWALRVMENKYAIVHFDNSATHLGLDTEEVLLNKLKQAGPNFAHVAARHPLLMELQGTMAARLIATIPKPEIFAPLMKFLATSSALPPLQRARALRLWRAIWAAKYIREKKSAN